VRSRNSFVAAIYFPKRKGIGAMAKNNKGTPPQAAANRAETVREILNNVEKTLMEQGAKATLGDYIRLLQLQKEVEQAEQKEIRVTWVEPVTTDSET
jgi:hypothetical protein